MERLTERRDAQWVIPLRQDGKQKWALCKAGMSLDDNTEYLYGDHANRLAAYEDTGLDPEKVKEFLEDVESRFVLWINKRYGIPAMEFMDIMQAEKDGRLVVLPCKLHEPIFYIADGDWCDDVPYEVSIGQRQGEWRSLLFTCEDGFGFYGDDIGKTIFLTREEAEAAPEKREEVDNETD